mmetsp:Transcript_4183/g.10082  ORF Transcript_4183/g.10082 Transcript_4183/m.10082 type:complete len:225 (+) Transcript_4183:339-1013(+)
MSSHTTSLLSRFISTELAAALLARSSSSSGTPWAIAISCSERAGTMCWTAALSKVQVMPTRPVSLNRDPRAWQLVIQGFPLRMFRKSRECMPLPGPPALNEEPPPSRYCITVTSTEPLTSFQPPANSKASTTVLCGESSAGWRNSPPTYLEGTLGTGFPEGGFRGISASMSCARLTSSECSTPLPDRTILGPVKCSATNSSITSGVSRCRASGVRTSGRPRPPS